MTTTKYQLQTKAQRTFPASQKKSQKVLTLIKIIDRIKNVVSKATAKFKPPSSSGLGHLPFTEATGIRLPLGVLIKKQTEIGLLFIFDSCLLRFLYQITLEMLRINRSSLLVLLVPLLCEAVSFRTPLSPHQSSVAILKGNDIRLFAWIDSFFLLA